MNLTYCVVEVQKGGITLHQLTISDNRRYFLSSGQPFFYLADTLWSAFTNISLEEWAVYLDYRRSQGFNVLQMNMLQQWDASGTDLDYKPFPVLEDGSFDFYTLNTGYFERAEQMVQMAVDKGFVPALVLLWCNYIPDTWAARLREEKKMPLDAVAPYVEYVTDKFSRFHPIYIVSGDTDFPSELANAYYETALRLVKERSPHCLTTLHIQGRLGDIPDTFATDPNLDFYMYQSGHNIEFQHKAYELAMEFNQKPHTRPVLNSEPCYEQMGYSRRVYGRFKRADVRKVAWQSLLSGAGAGITYGAHGIWSWHKKGKRFGVTGEGFDSPYEWSQALKFEGAWDYGFAKWVFETYQLVDVQPWEVVLNNTQEIRAAATPAVDRVAVYIPINTVVTLNADLSGYELTMIDLENRRFAKPAVTLQDQKTVLGMHDFEGDVLVLGVKKP